MSEKDRPKKRSKSPGSLSDEDRALWQHVTRTVRPYQGQGHAMPPTASFNEPAFEPHGTPGYKAHGKPAQQTDERPKPRHTPARGAEPDRAGGAPPLSHFEARKARKIRSGRIEIEARLDMHGLRQDEAHRALRSFLLSSHARGLKWVLVITGKGTFARDYDHAHDEGAIDWDWSRPQRGILRRSVPQWLAEPELRAVVVSYTSAAIQHGGEGALYVQLRSRRK